LKKRNERNRNAADELSPELKALLKSTRPVESLDRDDLAASVRDLERDPDHVADTRKAAFVEDVLRALDEDDIGKSELARRLGKTRQQLSCMLNEEKLNNFTIETMAEIAAVLGRHLLVRMLGPNQRVRIEPAPVMIEDVVRRIEETRATKQKAKPSKKAAPKAATAKKRK